MLHLYRRCKLDFLVCIATFIVTLLFDTELGLLCGLGLSLLVLPWTNRGGALLVRFFLQPQIDCTDPCRVVVICLKRLQRCPAWVRSRLGNYLVKQGAWGKGEGKGKGNGGSPSRGPKAEGKLVVVLSAAGVELDWEDEAATTGFVALVREACQSAWGAGVREPFVLVAGLPPGRRMLILPCKVLAASREVEVERGVEWSGVAGQVQGQEPELLLPSQSPSLQDVIDSWQTAVMEDQRGPERRPADTKERVN